MVLLWYHFLCPVSCSLPLNAPVATNVLPTLLLLDEAARKFLNFFKSSLYIPMLLPNNHFEMTYVTLCRQTDGQKLQDFACHGLHQMYS